MQSHKVKDRSQYDTTLKDLFEKPPQRLLQILIGREAVELLPVEFASIQKRLPDLVFLLEDDSIFHLELQSNSEGMDWRMLMYYSLIRQRYPSRVLVQKVLYIGLNEWHPGSAIEEPSLSFRYEVVDIRNIDCRELMDSSSLEENILAILCRIDNKKVIIQEILYRISELPIKARADALTKLVILSRLRRLETVVKMEAEEMSLTFNLMENDVFRPIIMKAQMDSEQKGRQEGEATILTRQLQRRFGDVPEWANKKIAEAEPSSLEEWSLRIFDAQSLDEVFSDKA
ncbi:MAG: DUF4351 domain-containing protein [Magnetococcales bacterium]|nr:DUF4351 domain-containing protein [Magnetococcales bacterium]MBF0151209.1 DUF4351 domain-containing protein [Magnetococcales bacterium]MBF0173078.1 DUF4351 domain-containing protein [Magnetococcales bacterium]MBF0630159.1 DUF4351 domain-containing protein [Magnetococcales bacterium]